VAAAVLKKRLLLILPLPTLITAVHAVLLVALALLAHAALNPKLRLKLL